MVKYRRISLRISSSIVVYCFNDTLPTVLSGNEDAFCFSRDADEKISVCESSGISVFQRLVCVLPYGIVHVVCTQAN